MVPGRYSVRFWQIDECFMKVLVASLSACLLQVTFTYCHSRPRCLILNFNPHRTCYFINLGAEREQVFTIPSALLPHQRAWQRHTLSNTPWARSPRGALLTLTGSSMWQAGSPWSSALPLALDLLLHNAKLRCFYSGNSLWQLLLNHVSLSLRHLCLPKNILL